MSSSLEHALKIVDDDWAAHDPLLAPVLPVVLGRGVGHDWHRAGTFKHHLLGVSRSLTLWRQPDRVRLLGLLHSVYGNAYIDVEKFDAASERGLLRDLVGADVEALVHRFCTISRNEFVQRLLGGELATDGTLALREGAAPVTLPAADVAALLVVSLADMPEQWFSWQDEIFSGYPWHRAVPTASFWAQSLWPGPMRPSARVHTLLSRLAALLRHPALAAHVPLPPIYDDCSRTIDEADEASAAALYWSVVQQQIPQVDAQAALGIVEQAGRLNPWVGEIALLRSQLRLIVGDFDAAAEAAAQGLERLSEWGASWDKRMGWETWISWGRVLAHAAATRSWPADLHRHNNLAIPANA